MSRMCFAVFKTFLDKYLKSTGDKNILRTFLSLKSKKLRTSEVFKNFWCSCGRNHLLFSKHRLACSGFPYYLVRKITSKNLFYILFGSCEKAALEKVGYPICVPNWATLFWYLWGCQPHPLAFVPSCSIII